MSQKIIIYQNISKKDVTPLLTHWSYIFLALSHQYIPWPWEPIKFVDLPVEMSSQLFHPKNTPTDRALVCCSWRHCALSGTTCRKQNPVLLIPRWLWRPKKELSQPVPDNKIRTVYQNYNFINILQINCTPRFEGWRILSITNIKASPRKLNYTWHMHW